MDRLSTRCPWKEIPPLIKQLAAQYPHYKNGFLLESGGLNDQPAYWLDAMREFDNRLNYWRNERTKEEQKKHGS